MSEAFRILGEEGADILIVADHASNHVPADIDLGIDPALLDAHIALDRGVADVAALLVREVGACAILGGVSRLVIDCNREPRAPGLVPLASDGHAIPGNDGADIAARIARFYDPYHAAVARLAGQPHRPFILSLHSFTPALRSQPGEQRPWEIGILYNRDERAARAAIPWLERAGLIVGDQQPYSGTLLNATMNRHAEARGRPYLGVEMRQDLVADRAGQARFAALLAPLLRHCHGLFG
jgi:predicted N-formylglutamate amidohydrolase